MAGSSRSWLGVSVHVAEVEADYKVDPSALDGEDKGLKQVEDVSCHRSLHQTALRDTLDGGREHTTSSAGKAMTRQA